MKALMIRLVVSLGVVATLGVNVAHADKSMAEAAKEVNTKMVKLFGSGGFRGLAAYGTGILVSKDGYILTINSPMLDTRDLRVHLSDGRRYHAKVIVSEPILDVALVKIDTVDELDLPFFDIAATAKQPLVKAGRAIMASSNTFEIATRSEPMSVQRGIVAAYTKLKGKRGVFAADYQGDVYVLDAITNNPGAAGGAVTTRSGQLLGLIGKELRNELTNTWLNYAVPVQATLSVVEDDGKKRTISIAEIVAKNKDYRVVNIDRSKAKQRNYHGIVLVPNVVEFTPPYVEAIHRDSPAAKSGLKPDDLIVYVDGLKIASINELNEMLSRVPPNQDVRLEVRRGDDLTTISLKMAEPKTKKKQ